MPSASRSLPHPVAVALFALLVVATLAAFALAQRLKREPLLVDKVEVSSFFTPDGDGRHDRMRICFRVTRPDRVDVQVLSRGGRLMKTLARDVELDDYRFYTFSWDGTTRFGREARPGVYHLRVRLRGQDRVLVPGPRSRLRREPPRPGARPERVDCR